MYLSLMSYYRSLFLQPFFFCVGYSCAPLLVKKKKKKGTGRMRKLGRGASHAEKYRKKKKSTAGKIAIDFFLPFYQSAYIPFIET